MIYELGLQLAVSPPPTQGVDVPVVPHSAPNSIHKSVMKQQTLPSVPGVTMAKFSIGANISPSASTSILPCTFNAYAGTQTAG